MKRNIFNRFIKGFVLIFLIICTTRCTDNFIDYNTDKTQLMKVTTKEISQLYSAAQIYACGWLTTDDYNRMCGVLVNHQSGYMTTLGITYEQNAMNPGYQNSCFNDVYTQALPTLQNIFALTRDEPELQDEYAVALVWKVWIMQQMTDLWGPIPYTDGGIGLKNTTYESQKDVYYLMFDDLEKAIDIMTTTLTGDAAANAYGICDMIYNGSIQKWLKFANSLRLRMAIRISNIDPSKAKEEGEAAANGITMESGDDAGLDVTSWNDLGNGLSRVNDWYSSLMSSNMESFLKGYNDPRMEQYFDPVDDTVTVGIDPELYNNNGGYHGMASGFITSVEANYAKYYSRPSMARWSPATRYTYPIAIMYASETAFLKAEGAWRGWNMGGNAQEFYESGIRTSMEQWTEISSDSIQKYLQSENTPVPPQDYLYNHAAASDIPVKFSADQQKQYEQIITQKWLANFPISVEAFAEYRRTRLPRLYSKAASSNTNIDVTKGQIVTRLPFVEGEYNTQPEQVQKAIELLGNNSPADLENVPLWWDVNNNGDISPGF